jgi:HEPN domain-containing protein
MKPEDPDDPQAWLSRARSNLKLAEKGGQIESVFLEDLCFNAQQAAEKALKAVYLARGLDFPRTHSIVRLVDVLESSGVKIPANVKKADILTQYAVESRYPGPVEKVTEAEYREALKLAAKVVFWVESIL